MNYKHVALFQTALIAVLVLIGCSEAEYRDRQTVESQQGIYAVSQPVPMFDWSQDRDILIQIYSQKNEARTTYSVLSSDGTGEPRFMCPSLGFALPADTSLTNPLTPYAANGAVIEQPEPNGLFSSKNTDGTYVLCVRKNGDVVPVYTELKVTTFPFAVRWENGELVEIEDSPTTIKIEQRRSPAKPQAP